MIWWGLYFVVSVLTILSNTALIFWGVSMT
jgi:hypothetical protein